MIFGNLKNPRFESQESVIQGHQLQNPAQVKGVPTIVGHIFMWQLILKNSLGTPRTLPLEIVTISRSAAISLREHRFRPNPWAGAEPDCFCDCSAISKPILDFSKDSESSGRPLDDSIGVDVRICPIFSWRLARCPKMSEYVRKCPKMHQTSR